MFTRQRRLQLCGVVQSPTGISAKAKQRALAQAGIYACGQFKDKERKIASVNLFKDMTACVTLASTRPTNPGDDSLGVLKI